MPVLAELQRATTTALAHAGPAVVRIGRGLGRGAGFVLGEGLVVTNAHNLRGAQTTVTFPDGRSATGDVAGVDADGDLAVVTVDTAGAPPLSWAGPSPEATSGARPAPEAASGAGEDVAAGQVVFALARPAGGGTRITAGAVSAVGRAFRGPRGRLIDGGVEHTAPLGPGSSGGPLVDADGRLVAINTHRLGDGFTLAQPATAALRTRLEALGRGESPHRRRLGVALAPAHATRRLRASVGLPERDGLLVRGVEDASPAAGADLRHGDLLVSADGTPLSSVDDLARALDAGGRRVVIGVVRGTDELEVTVRFEDADPQR